MPKIHSGFSDTETNRLLFVAEFLALLAGNDFAVQEIGSNLFRAFDKSDFWKKLLFETKPEPSKAVQEEPEQSVKNMEQDAAEEAEDMFGGMEEEKYEVEASYEELSGNAISTSGLNLRNPGNNHYIKK